MRNCYYSLLFILFCIPVRVFAQDIFHLYLIGDAGEPSAYNYAYGTLLRQQLGNESAPAGIVFLGDNIYPRGLANADEKDRKRGEGILQAQLDLVNAGNHPVWFIPGNHDWKKGHAQGWEYIRNQAAWIDSLHKSNIHFLPEGGCPGPVEVELGKDVVLLIIDTQWFLHPWEKPEGENSACENKSIEEVIASIEDALKRNKGKQVIVAAHHPIFTYGEHGGYYTLKDHIFPLTSLNKDLYVPLPVVGSIYPVYRKVFGDIQDLANPNYKAWSQPLRQIMEKYPGTIYVAGHEHALQYSFKDSVHYIVSGGGSKCTPVKHRGYAQYASSHRGYTRIIIRADRTVAVEFYHVEEGENIVKPEFTKELGRIPAASVNNGNAAELIQQGYVTIKASDRYKAGHSHEHWLGTNYRAEWSEPVKVPVFDIGREQGGLKILKRGGGMQTLSLRLEDAAGREFVLRSVEKYPEKAVPAPFRKTFAQDLVQDQISAAHPYGALVVPPLATVAGIYHAEPKLVFIPDDPRFGEYQQDFANQLMLFEQRPANPGDIVDAELGKSSKIISTDKLLEKLQDDNDNRVDQEFTLRNRLFDMWIGDWDRHDDQWRWAEFDTKGKGKIYRPVPRDRDQAFFVNEGILPGLVSRKWAFPKFQGFDDEIEWVPGFMFNARYFDRSFLSALPKETWIKTAEYLSTIMTDDVIEKAVHEWPEEIYKLHGETVIRKLKSRRAKLASYALQHYLFLAKEVDIVGSKKEEWFKIETLPAGIVRVSVYKSKEKESPKLLYQREFYPAETKEIRLYGMSNDDTFDFTGSESTSIKIRIIGGDGTDRVVNTSSATPLVYDQPKGIKTEGNVYDHTSSSALVNEYDRKAFKYNTVAPLIYGNYNVDDGVFLGGGFIATTHGFRKNPFKSRHLFLGSYAIKTSSFNFKYDGRFTKLVGGWDLEVDLDVKSPNYVNNFFGWGNESVFNQNIDDQPSINVRRPIDYYRVRFREYAAVVKLARKIGQSGFFKAGPVYQHIGLEAPEGKDRYIEEYAASLPVNILEKGKDFWGLTYSWGVDKVNNPIMPARGIRFQQTSRYMTGSSSSDGNFTSHNASLIFYQSFRIPARVTFALRAGGGFNTGTYQFYQAQVLDGKTELRGFRKTRFYGDRELYFNNEVRVKLANIRSYLFPASLGILGFYDIGRIWYRNDEGIDPTASSGKSTQWHNGVGGGVWFTPFNLSVVSLEAGHSTEGTLAYVRLGFLF